MFRNIASHIFKRSNISRKHLLAFELSLKQNTYTSTFLCILVSLTSVEGLIQCEQLHCDLGLTKIKIVFDDKIMY